MKTLLPVVLVAAAFSTQRGAAQQPVLAAVLNGASFSGAVSPGAWVTIYGTGLAADTVTATSLPLPRQLGGVSATFGGVAAALGYVSPTQLNAVIPFETAIPSNKVIPVVVTAAGRASPAFNIRLERSSPGIFTRTGNGQGRAFVFDSAYRVPVVTGKDVLILYATGLGPTTPAGSSVAGGAPVEPLNRASGVDVYIGEAKAEVLFAGLAPGFPGIYQVNVQPAGIASDRVYLRSGGWQSNVADVEVEPGANVQNVTGTIQGLYPASDPDAEPFRLRAAQRQTASVMMVAGGFSVGMDILDSARPFWIVATCEAASSIILVDPDRGVYEASVTVPAAGPRGGNFTGSEFGEILDLGTCQRDAATCVPFPRSLIPLARFDGASIFAASLLALPNTPVPGSSMGLLKTTGTAKRGSRFTIDIQTSPEARFGGYLQLAVAGGARRSTDFKLYVDGKLVASKTASYDVFQQP